MSNIKKLVNYIKSEKAIILTLLVLLIVGLLCWIWKPTSEFGLNFFTEISGATITVFILDRLIKNREEKKNIPLKLAAYEDVRLFTSRYSSFWTDAFHDCVPEDDPETVEYFFSDNGMKKILRYLNIDAKANVASQINWFDYIVSSAKEFKNHGDKVLDRHPNLDPIAYGYLHNIIEGSMINCLIQSPGLKNWDAQNNFPRVKILQSYCVQPNQEEYEAILGLIKWCEESYLQLLKHRTTIKKVSEYTPKKKKNETPKSMILEIELEKQLKALTEHQQRSQPPG